MVRFSYCIARWSCHLPEDATDRFSKHGHGCCARNYLSEYATAVAMFLLIDSMTQKKKKKMKGNRNVGYGIGLDYCG